MAEPTDSRRRLVRAVQDLNNDEVEIYEYYYKDEPQHTGILIRCKNSEATTSEFTIDVSNVNGLLQTIKCIFWNCEAKLVVKEIDPGQRSMYQATKRYIRTFREETRSDATRCVKRLLELTSKSFQLFLNNCRDHTDRAIEHLCRDGQCSPKGKEEALRNTAARRIRDFGIVSFVIYVIYKQFY